MRGTQELLSHLAAIGARIEPAGHRLILRAGPVPIPADLVSRVRNAKTEVLVALRPPNHLPPAARWQLRCNPAEWRARHREALVFWGTFHTEREAAALAWGEMVALWHRRHGERLPPEICAGCRTPIDDAEVLTLAGGARVHIATLDCLIAFGERWRGAAARSLTAMGLVAPTKDDRP